MNNRASCISVSQKESIRGQLLATGACAVGFAPAEQVPPHEWNLFEDWLDRGDNAGMAYMHNYPEIRRDPRLLLDNAKTVISLAFPFKPEKWRDGTNGIIACYAYGRDYHKELRKLLKPELKKISEETGGAKFRICIDSAPVLERYWGEKTGIGFRGDNGCLIIPGYGSMVFLTETITDLKIPEDSPLRSDCGHCGACVKACPGNAIGDGGTIDCRKCISYLSIEHRGEWDTPESLQTMNTPQGRNTIFGCDICLRVCPHNRNVPSTTITAFQPSDTILNIKVDDLREVTSDEELNSLIPSSPISRAGIAGIYRNINYKLNN